MAPRADHPDYVPGLLDPGTPHRYKNVAFFGRVLTLRKGEPRLAANPGCTLATTAKAPPSLDDISVTIRHQRAGPV